MVLVLVAALLVGCKKKDHYMTNWDCWYTWEFVVENKTGSKEIKINTDYPWGPYANHYVLAPKESDVIMDTASIGGCNAVNPMPDIFAEMDDFHLGFGDEYPFFMTIDGETVSADIWLLKNWSFEAGLYDSTYTLTVTDELLEQLAEAAE